MIQTLIAFLKNPVYAEDGNTESQHRFWVFLKLLGIAILISFGLSLIIGLLQEMFDLDFGDHAIEEAVDKYPTYILFLAAVFAAPILEELIFRGPLFFFKGSKYFRYVFYAATLIFGFYHITNFEITTTTLLFSPLLVAPQLSVGAILGFIRVRFNLTWAILFHAAYNLILVGPMILMKLLNIPLE